MINVTIFRDEQQITAFELSGHAGSGPYGYDLVCASVSAVSFGAVNAIIQLCGMEPEIEQGHEGGYLYVALPSSVNEETKKRLQLLLEGMLISLQTIEREYQQFIKIKNK